MTKVEKKDHTTRSMVGGAGAGGGVGVVSSALVSSVASSVVSSSSVSCNVEIYIYVNRQCVSERA